MNDAADQSIASKLDELFRPWNRSDAPGFAVGVAQHGSVLYRRGFGLASIEQGTANTPQTRMRIGSTSKHFTCLSILLLQEDGKLDIEARVGDYLPELAGHANGLPTLRQLMQHTSGIRDPLYALQYLKGGSYAHAPCGATLQLLQRFTEVDSAPGAQLIYSNAGYTLLSLVVERLSGIGYGEFLRERLCAVLGMHDTRLLASDLEIVPNMATLHMPQQDGSWRRGIYPSEELLGSGGMISSVDDMLSWLAHLRAPHKRVGSSASWDQLLQGTRFNNGLEHSYCLGITREPFRGVETIHHAGATLGSQCQMLTVPAHELDIIVMSNRMDGPAPLMARKIVERVLEAELEPQQLPPAAESHRGLIGNWYSASARTLAQIKPYRLEAEQPEALLLSLHGCAAGVLQQRGERLSTTTSAMSPADLIAPPADASPKQTLEIRIAGTPHPFQRLPETPPDASQLAPALCARYRSRDFGKEIEIIERDGKLYLDFLPLVGKALWELRPLSSEVLLCGELDSNPPQPIPCSAAISLELRDGKVVGFWQSAERFRKLRFDRIAEAAH